MNDAIGTPIRIGDRVAAIRPDGGFSVGLVREVEEIPEIIIMKCEKVLAPPDFDARRIGYSQQVYAYQIVVLKEHDGETIVVEEEK